MEQAVNTERVARREQLKAKAMPLAMFGEDVSVAPLTYNVNQGVVIFADESGKVFALPDNDNVNEIMEAAEIGKDETISVPTLNDFSTYPKGVGENVKNEWRQKVYKEGNHKPR